MDTLDHSLREFIPMNGAWLPLETLLEQAFSDPDPKRYYHAIFNLFERFPEEDGPVFWSALHGMEHFGDYEDLLVQYFRRWPYCYDAYHDQEDLEHGADAYRRN